MATALSTRSLADPLNEVLMRLIRPLLSNPPRPGGALRDILAGEAATGVLTFSRFMELALYHPKFGYYMTRSPQGPAGDYLTSPIVHPVFGWAVASQLEEFWQAADRPSRFDVVEWGAGDGSLCDEALTWAAGTPFAGALRWTLIDASPRARSQQAETCQPWIDEGRVRLASPEDLEPAPGPGCLLSNELFDSLPVELVSVQHGRLMQAYVVEEAGVFSFDWRPASGPLATRLREQQIRLAEGQRAEVCLKLDNVVDAMNESLLRGYFLALDYGYPAPRLYASWRKAGTLMTFSRQTAGTDPLVRPGRQDITSHVDFTALTRAGIRFGWRTVGFTSQAAFLHGLGAGQAARELLRLRPDAAEKAASLHRGVEQLTDAAGLGRIRALLMAKGLPRGPFSGFQDDESAALESDD